MAVLLSGAEEAVANLARGNFDADAVTTAVVVGKHRVDGVVEGGALRDGRPLFGLCHGPLEVN